MKALLRYAGWPAMTGLLAAVLMLVLIPRLGHSPTNATAALNSADEHRQGLPASYAAAVDRAAPAVVTIHTDRPPQNHGPLSNSPASNSPAGDGPSKLAQSPQEQALTNKGSGVIVSEKGYILTNHHVTNGADNIVVQLHDGQMAHATVIGTDADSDLTVLRIDRGNLTAINIGAPEQAQVGDVVLAIGNPFGIGQSVTQGIISASSRPGQTPQLLQTDAAINPGNSGGALVDVYGNLLGINTAIVNDTHSGHSVGIGFAISATTAMNTLQEIIEFS